MDTKRGETQMRRIAYIFSITLILGGMSMVQGGEEKFVEKRQDIEFKESNQLIGFARLPSFYKGEEIFEYRSSGKGMGQIVARDTDGQFGPVALLQTGTYGKTKMFVGSDPNPMKSPALLKRGALYPEAGLEKWEVYRKEMLASFPKGSDFLKPMKEEKRREMQVRDSGWRFSSVHYCPFAVLESFNMLAKEWSTLPTENQVFEGEGLEDEMGVKYITLRSDKEFNVFRMERDEKGGFIMVGIEPRDPVGAKLKAYIDGRKGDKK